MSRCRVCVAATALAIWAVIAAPAMAGTIVYATGFEASEGYAAGNLAGQQGWFGDGGNPDLIVVNVTTAFGGGMCINQLDLGQGGANANQYAYHSLGSLSHLAASTTYSLTFDAVNAVNYGRYGTDAFGIVTGSNALGGQWRGRNLRHEDAGNSADLGGWEFVGPDGNALFQTAWGVGVDKVVKLKVVVDTISNQIWGEYDFDGQGYVQTPKYSGTSTQLAMDNLLCVHRWNENTMVGSSGRPVGFDNVALSQVPEPSAVAALAMGLISLVCYAWRRHK